MAMSSVGRDALDNCEDDTNASRPPDDPTPMGRSPRNAQSFMFFESGSPTAARATEDAARPAMTNNRGATTVPMATAKSSRRQCTARFQNVALTCDAKSALPTRRGFSGSGALLQSGSSARKKEPVASSEPVPKASSPPAHLIPSNFSATLRNASSRVAHPTEHSWTPNCLPAALSSARSAFGKCCVAQDGRLKHKMTSFFWEESERPGGVSTRASVAPGTAAVTSWQISVDSESIVAVTRRTRSEYPPPNAVLTNSGDPAAASLPPCTTHTRSLSASASSMKCVVRSTEVALQVGGELAAEKSAPHSLVSSLEVATSLRPANPRITSQACRRESGSIPAVGSSRSTTSGSPMNAIARESLRRCPPESVPAGRSASSIKPTATSFFSISKRTTSLYAAAQVLLSAAEVLFAATAPLSGRNDANSSRCSRTVRLGHSTSNWGHTPSVACAFV
mmetsp:Transcript_11705/g.43405  ORF Transcript_11705/g.43405 Transcript_11705/m.43405 type:complete len:451 (+) Transcript_11705:3472-4824(+)